MSRIPRRWAFFVPPLALLVFSGLIPLRCTWSGTAGTPTTSRVYVLGEFRESGPLLRLERPPRAECFSVLQGEAHVGSLCGRGSVRVWVENALVEVSVGARGMPQAAVAGARLTPGSVIGSGADPADPQRPRVPLRGYGIPYRAATVSTGCPGRAQAIACIEIHDALGRLAIARSGPGEPHDDLPLRQGKRYPLYRGDHLWLGLIPYAADTATVAGRPGLTLIRSSRPVPHEDAPGMTGLGGDRRWLGRLWPVDVPDAADTVPSSFEVYPSRRRYFPDHLSRQRTNYESEDLVQRLVDGQWLCLRPAPATPRVEWRPLERPGCDAPLPGFVPSREQLRDYRTARSGLLAIQIRGFVAGANEQLASGDFLTSPSALPLAFGWELRRGDSSAAGWRGLSPVQPHPYQLWGIRFGASLRAIRRPSGPAPLPDLYLRSSTATHLVEVAAPGREPFTLYLAGDVPGDPARAGGAICLDPSASARQSLAGTHHRVGAVLIGRDPSRAAPWSDAPGAPCGGCRLRVWAGRDGRSAFHVAREGDCAALSAAAAAGVLQHGDSLVWNGGAAVLRFLRRGEHAWAARAEARGGERYYAHEFYQAGGLVPLLGDPLGFSGVEAALREYTAQVPDSLLAMPVELTVDGDLQIEAASVVARVAAETGVNSTRGDAARITAVVLDASTGEVLAAVNHFGGEEPAAPPHRGPTAWDLGTSRAHPWQNTAFLRRMAIGSTMKIVGAYALVNHGLRPGSPPVHRTTLEPLLRGRDNSGPGMLLARSGGRHAEPTPRFCLGSHALPLGDDAFTADLFVERFASSCNNFFVMTGFRHASARAAALTQPTSGATSVPPSHLGMTASPPTLLQRQDEPIAARVRQGLATDALAPGAPPRSIYGLWLRLGFQPTPRRGPLPEAADTFGFMEGSRRVDVPLGTEWFAPRPASPALKPGRDFNYPFVPSPGRLSEDSRPAGALEEFYDGRREPVRTVLDDNIGRADVQYAQLLIGQGEAGVSALGLAVMYAPVGRSDGRTVRPCVFRAACTGSAGARVFDPAGPGAATLYTALQRVVGRGGAGGTAARAWMRAGGGSLRATWGGKTGTYEVVTFALPPNVSEELHLLTEHACGVAGTSPPQVGALARYVGPRWDAQAKRLVQAKAGAARGAWACEGGLEPLNPGGIHRFGRGPEPAALDSLVGRVWELRDGGGRPLDYHAFVALSLPGHQGAPARAGDTDGIVIAVLVDDTRDIAVRIGTELALLVERWAPGARRPPIPGGP